MKKNKNMKATIISGALVCAIALGTYSGYSYFYPSRNSTQESKTSDKSMFKKEPEPSIIPKKETKKNATVQNMKPETSSNSVEQFRNDTSASYQNERRNALNLLDNQIKDEKNKAANTPSVLPLINPTPQTPQTNNNQSKPKPEIPTKPVEPEIPEKPINPVDPIDPPVIEIDYAALALLVQQAQAVNTTLYFSAGVTTLKTELMIAERMLSESASTQIAVNNQVSRLQSALSELIPLGNKTDLQALYNHSETIKTDIYTDETVEALQAAKSKVLAVLSITEVTQEVIDQAKSDLQQAIDSLKEKDEPYLSLAYLERLVAEAKVIDLTQYTETTSTVFQNKLEQVTIYLSEGTYTKAENEQFLDELQAAIDQLQKKVDLTQLKALEAQATSIGRTLYTDESLTVLDNVLSKVTNALSDDEVTQEQADSLVQELLQAMNNLKEKEVIADE